MSTDRNWVDDVGAPAFSAVADMVAALECDYTRMDELREERDEWVAADEEQGRTVYGWAAAFPNLADDLAELATDAGDCADREDAEQRIMDDPLSVRVFGEKVDGRWEVDRVEFLLCTGGPAVRIMAEVSEYGEPRQAWMEVQDWGKPWTEYHRADSETLLTYCRTFGEFTAD